MPGSNAPANGDAKPDAPEAAPGDWLMAMPGPPPPKPKKRKILEHESVYLDALPSASMYERSFMHRDTVTHVVFAPTHDFFITASVDGHLKFWKKRHEGVEFVKHFRAHGDEIRIVCERGWWNVRDDWKG